MRVVIPALVVGLVLMAGCSTLKDLAISNEHRLRGDCIAAQPWRGISGMGRTREGALCRSTDYGMGMIPLWTHRW